MIKQFYFNQFNFVCHLFAFSLNVKQSSFAHRGAYQVSPHRVRVGLVVMAMNRYSIFSKAPALLERYHQIIALYPENLLV